MGFLFVSYSPRFEPIRDHCSRLVLSKTRYGVVRRVSPTNTFPRKLNAVHLNILRTFVPISRIDLATHFRRITRERFACRFRHVFLWIRHHFFLFLQCFPVRIVFSSFFASFFTGHVLCCAVAVRHYRCKTTYRRCLSDEKHRTPD